MVMPYLEKYPVAQQETQDSCWASAGRSIVNWYHGLDQSGPNPEYRSDKAFAEAWNSVKPGHDYQNIDVQRSAAAALADLGFINNTDDRAIPRPGEICDAINDGMPLLAIVGDKRPDPSPDLAYEKGHWVVIVGITIDTDAPDESATLQVFDPADGMVHHVSYDPELYQPGQPCLYWQNTSYVDPYYVDELPADHLPLTPLLPAPGGSVPPSGTRQLACRGQITLQVQWTPTADGIGVALSVLQTSGHGSPRTVEAKLAGISSGTSFALMRFGEPATSIELRLQLSQSPSSDGSGLMQRTLWASYPLSESEARHARIASWALASDA
jgi:hypothetical protein